jgi:hypothetical protein
MALADALAADGLADAPDVALGASHATSAPSAQLNHDRRSPIELFVTLALRMGAMLREKGQSNERLATRCHFFATRSIIEVSLRPLKLTEQAQLCLGKRTGNGLAALIARSVARPASPVPYLAKTAAIADRDLTMPRRAK